MRRSVAPTFLIMSLSLIFAAACGATQDGGLDTGPTVGVSGSGSPTTSATATGVDVTLKDYAIALDPDAVDAGEVTFRISNQGPSEHEFVVVSTDLAPNDLPVKDGAVDEDQIDVVDEAEGIAAGDSTELTVDLDPGSYVVFCNIDGHYVAGMHAALTVR